MPRRIEKKAFLFYASTLDTLQELEAERQGKVAMALIEYSLEDHNYFAESSDSLSILEPAEHIIFRPVIYEINVQKRRYYNKYLIHGAIETIYSEIAERNLDKTDQAILDILNERLKSVKIHDELNVPEELTALLPESAYKKFESRYRPKTCKHCLSEILEKWLKREEINLSDKEKNRILGNLMKEYYENSTFFEDYEDLLKQYIVDLKMGGTQYEA